MSQLDHKFVCQTAREAFYFDKEELSSQSLFTLRKMYREHATYNAVVSIRLMQYYRARWHHYRSHLDEILSIGRLRSLLFRRPALFFQAAFYRSAYKYYGSLFRRRAEHILVRHGSDISPYARIGKNLWGTLRNIAITADSEIGENVTLRANVSITSHKGSPKIGNSVEIKTGAVIVGPVTIGDNAVIGANSVVMGSVPANTTVFGVPAKTIFRRKKVD